MAALFDFVSPTNVVCQKLFWTSAGLFVRPYLIKNLFLLRVATCYIEVTMLGVPEDAMKFAIHQS